MITAPVVAIALLLGIVVINWTVAVGACYYLSRFAALSARKELNSQLIVDAATGKLKLFKKVWSDSRCSS